MEPRQLLAAMASDDFYSGVGNTPLEVNATGTFGSDPTVKVTDSLFANDSDVNSFSFDHSSALGGTVNVTPEGSLSYQPPVGIANQTDSFSYSIKNLAGEQATATVWIELGNLVWYVDHSQAVNGDGTSNAPFNTFSEINGANGFGDVDRDGEILFVYTGDSPIPAGLRLEPNQQLVGQGVDLNVDGISLHEAGDRPVLVMTGQDVISLASHNQIRGLDIVAEHGFDGIRGGDVESLTVEKILFRNGGIQIASTADVTFNGSQIEVINVGMTDNTIGNDISISIVTTGVLNFSLTDSVIVTGDDGDRPTGILTKFDDGNVNLLRNVIQSTDDSASSAVIVSGRLFGTVIVNENDFFGTVSISVDSATPRTGTYWASNNLFRRGRWAHSGKYYVSRFEANEFADALGQDELVELSFSNVFMRKFVIDTLRIHADRGGLRMSKAPGGLTINSLDINTPNGQALNLSNSKLQVGSGNISAGRTVRIHQMDLDLTLDSISIDQRHDEIGNSGLSTRGSSGNLVVNGRVAVANTKNAAAIKLTGHKNAPLNASFNGEVAIENDSARTTGIETSYVLATFDGPVSIVQRGELSIGVELASQVDFHGEVLIESWLGILTRSRSRLLTNARFDGGIALNVYRAISHSNGRLTIAGDSNHIVSSGGSILSGVHFRDYRPTAYIGEDGITIHSVSYPEGRADLLVDNGYAGGDIRIKGPIDVETTEGVVRFKMNGNSQSNVYFESPLTRIRSTGGIAFELKSVGDFVFNGKIHHTAATKPIIFMKNRDGGRTEFNGAVSTSKSFGIQVENGWRRSELIFNESVKLGDLALGRNYKGLTIRNASADIEFNMSFHSHITGSEAIDAFGAHTTLDINQAHLSSKTGSGIIANNLQTLNIREGDISVANGQAIKVIDTRGDISLNRISATEGAGPAIELRNLAGPFSIVDATSISKRDGHGITIVDTNDISLNGLQLHDSVMSGIQLSNVRNFELSQSTIARNGSTRHDHAIRAHQASGDWKIHGSKILDTSGLHDVAITNSLNTRLDQFQITNSEFGGNSLDGGASVVVTAYAKSSVNVEIRDNDFSSNNGDHILVRTNGFAKANLTAEHNSIRDFRRGLNLQMRGSSELNFDLSGNEIAGQTDGSSSYGVSILGASNQFGGGKIWGRIRNHQGTMGEISNNAGVHLGVNGQNGADASFVDAHLEFADNHFDRISGFAAINASLRGGDGNRLDLIATNNLFTNSIAGNRYAARVSVGWNLSSPSNIATATFKNNIIDDEFDVAFGLSNYDPNATLNLTAPIGNSEIGNSYTGTDGGVLLSIGATGNNNVAASLQDVIAIGEVNIVEE